MLSAPVDIARREFLIRGCQGVSAAFIPSSLRRFGFPFFDSPPAASAEADSPLQRSPSGEFHLHPHYRKPLSLDPLLLQTQSGLDEFMSEKYADQIAAILARWNAQWTQSLFDLGGNVDVIARVLVPAFAGASLKPSDSRVLRRAPVEIRRNTFSQTTSLSREAFLAELRAALGVFSRINTAEFQITSIDATSLPALRTRIRYELVGQRADLSFEQRVGSWELAWESAAGTESHLLSWRTLEETQSRCPGEAFRDITVPALRNSGAPMQLEHGSDYWRAAVDAACGIDVYGHNGVSVGDIDNDGFDDLYVCQPGGLPNRLFRNRGDGTLEDITDAAGVGVIENTACALFVDVDNDGHQDLIVVRANGPLLFLNDGRGRFRQKPEAFHFAQPPQGTFVGAAVADYDRDGWLDIYFCLYIYYQGAGQYKYPIPYFDANNGPPNFLMRNNRDATFSDVTAETGLNVNNTRYSFCCAWNDFNRDGWPDLYVVNDFGRKNLYRNNGDGTFTDVAAEADVEDIGAGMSACWFDFDNDGFDDLYVANMWTAAGERITMQPEFKRSSPAEVRMLYHKHAMGNSLFRNTSATSAAKRMSPFQDATDSSGARVGRWAWSSDSFDFDHDGFPDLYIANGMVSSADRNFVVADSANSDDLNSFFWRQVVAKSPDAPNPSHDYEQGWGAINELIRADRTWSGYERNILYANNGDGTFSDISGVAGLDFREDGRSFALADFDLDGRQELFLKNRNAPQLRILHNTLPGLPPSISFRLRGTTSNRDAIGSVITIEGERDGTGRDSVTDGSAWSGKQTRSLQAGSGFISQHSKDVFFGLGAFKGPIRATVHWPSGVTQEFHGLPADHRIWIDEGSPVPVRVEAFRPTPQPGWFDQSMGSAPSLDLSLSPPRVETWLLEPVAAPNFSFKNSASGGQHSLSALRGRPVLLHFGAAGDRLTQQDWSTFTKQSAVWASEGLQLVSVNFGNEEPRVNFPVVRGSEDIAAIYSILFRYLFDRHRDFPLPTSFLIEGAGEIVKVYQGPLDPAHVAHDFRNLPKNAAERLARALPFPGVTNVIEFGRNYLSFGSVYFQRGYFDQAAAAFEVALRDDPTSAEALYGRGSVLLEQQKNAEARDCFERALKSHALYPDTLTNSWNNLGLLAGRDGHTEEAIDDFRRALNLSPDDSIALNNLGSAYRQSKRWEEAKRAYEHSLELKPADADANYGMGMIYAQSDNIADAEEYLDKALHSRPDYPEALNNLGILYLRTHRRDQAVASFKQSIRVAPDFGQAYLNLARVHAIEGNKEDARSVLQELLKHRPNDPAALQMLGQLSE